MSDDLTERLRARRISLDGQGHLPDTDACLAADRIEELEAALKAMAKASVAHRSRNVRCYPEELIEAESVARRALGDNDE